RIKSAHDGAPENAAASKRLIPSTRTIHGAPNNRVLAIAPRGAERRIAARRGRRLYSLAKIIQPGCREFIGADAS
ncbi:MAG: hypothetical protein L0Y57_00330, partial [Beijerinckiaceae bacterium]|nr:hypothetical protein [Beijerinckiaceae bacterium]